MALKDSPYTGIIAAGALSLLLFKYCSEEKRTTKLSQPESIPQVQQEESNATSEPTVLRNNYVQFVPKIDLDKALDKYKVDSDILKKYRTRSLDSFQIDPRMYEFLKEATKEETKSGFPSTNTPREPFEGSKYKERLDNQYQADTLN